MLAATQGGGQLASANNSAAALAGNANVQAVANPAVAAVLPAASQGGPVSTAAAGGAPFSTLPTASELAVDKLKMALVECGMTDTTGLDRFITSQGLTGIPDLASLTPKDVKCLVETFNATCTGRLATHSIGFMQIKNISALAYAAKKSRSMNEDFDIFNWNQDAIASIRVEMSDFQQAERSSEPTKIPKPEDKSIDIGYEDWRSDVQTVFTQVPSSRGGGLTVAYISMQPLVLGTVISTEFEKLHYGAPLTGVIFEHDNRKVWAMLKGAVSATKLWHYIQRFDRASNGREAFLELDRVFLGPDCVKKRIDLCYLYIELGRTTSLLYTGEQSGFSFLSYAGKLKQKYAYIALHRSPIDERQQVHRLIGGITGDAKSKLTYAIEHVKDCVSGDMNSAITYLSGKVNDAYGEYNIKREQGRGNHRKISETRGGRGNGGGGRGNGGRYSDRGRGSGRGRGHARDGRTEVRRIDGHDVSDAVVHGTFPNDAFSNAEVRKYVFNRRRFLKSNANARGGGADKRKIQELSIQMKDLQDQLKKSKSADEETNGEHNPDKGGQAGAKFGRHARGK